MEQTNKTHSASFTSWSYFDVLSLAMAFTKNARFRADANEWYRVISDLKDQDPDLLKGVFFESGYFGATYSEEVEQFLLALERAGYLGRWNPSYRIYELDSDKKQALKSAYARLVESSEEIASGIKSMSSVIDAKLGLRHEEPDSSGMDVTADTRR